MIIGSEYIHVPDVPVGIARRKIGNNSYVYYTESRTYDLEKQQSRPKRVCIGKLHPDNPNYMIPNSNFDRFFRRETQMERKIQECQEELALCMEEIRQGYRILGEALESMEPLTRELKLVRELCTEEALRSDAGT